VTLLQQDDGDEIKSQKQLITRLLKTQYTELSDPQKVDIIDYLHGIDEDMLRMPSIRKPLTQFLTAHSQDIPNVIRERVRDFLYKITLEDAKYDFLTFVKLTAEVVIPNKFRMGRHIEIICEALQSLYESYVDPNKRTERLQVFLPPRSMKSVLCSILFPAWVLGRNPKLRVLLVGGSVQTAIDVFGRPLKNFIATAEYQEIFPQTLLDPKASSAQRFFTTVGGGYFCAGAGTGIAGRGGDIIICDDMLSEQTAFSKQERTKINNNYIPGIRSRSQPGAAELMVNTRWVLDDPSGFLLKVDEKSKRPWKIICVPAIIDEKAKAVLRRPGDPEGLYEVGTSYWPEWKPLEEIEEIKQAYMVTEPYKWWALYMQNPIPQDGNIVKHTDWQIWKNEKAPKVTQIIVSLDTAYDETERSDYSAFTVWGVFHNKVETRKGIQEIPNIIMLDAERGKWDFYELCQKCENLRLQWKPDYFIVEKKQSGIGLLTELYNRGFPTIPYDPRAKKDERLQAASILMRAGRVWVPSDKEWAMEVMEEVCGFPSAQNDDYTDTVSMAVIWMRDNGIIRHEAYDFADTDDEDDDGDAQYKHPSYWSALFSFK
jgi:predicted phage terminase large subunit-like protein